MLYNDGSSFFTNELWAFMGLLDCIHEHIHLKWVANMNGSNETLAFIVNNDKIWAMHMDPISKQQIVVTLNSYQTLIYKVKLEC
jgi:hypothetical protein